MLPMYKRVLLKLSGEQLAGKYEHGIDTDFGAWLAREVKQVVEAGIQVVIMVGGGNYARGTQLAGHGIQRVTADQIGMLATMMNALALTDIFEHENVATRCMTNVYAEQLAEPYVFRLALEHLEHGRVVIVAGGIGRPYLTTDTAALAVALELSCDVVMKATKVDGVYDKDPAQHADAKRYEVLSLQEAIANEKIKVMDRAALGLAFEHNLPILIFDALQPGNILRAARSETVGTAIRHP
jgi:uridylate kinase